MYWDWVPGVWENNSIAFRGHGHHDRSMDPEGSRSTWCGSRFSTIPCLNNHVKWIWHGSLQNGIVVAVIWLCQRILGRNTGDPGSPRGSRSRNLVPYFHHAYQRSFSKNLQAPTLIFCCEIFKHPVIVAFCSVSLLSSVDVLSYSAYYI